MAEYDWNHERKVFAGRAQTQFDALEIELTQLDADRCRCLKRIEHVKQEMKRLAEITHQLRGIPDPTP